jgi:signal transduction histidine kinase
MVRNSFSILVADDDEGDRIHIKRALKSAGIAFEVTEASDMNEAIGACDRPYDCAIVDYQMPGTNGLDGLQAIRARVPDLPIILATGQGDEDIASEAFRRGAMDYISKREITPSSIRRIIENATEKAALLKQAAEQRKALESFANVLAHDLKAPIRHLRLVATMMADAVKDGNYDELDQFHGHIDTAGRRLERLINTLADYNRIAEAEPLFEAVPLDTVLDGVIDNLRVAIDECEGRITRGALPTVLGNEPELIQLLQNLIGNAIKFCKEDTPAVHVDAEESDNGWRISVRDNGIGIPKASAREVFDPLKRLHSSKEYEGTGLGLAICKRIVERHNGEIWCESEEGKGTTFYFIVPSAEKMAA